MPHGGFVMKTNHPFLIFLAATMMGAAGETKNPEPRMDPRPGSGNRVQIALLLDTSNSMDGLIDQAKTQLWKVVNTFIDAKRDGEAPYVEVALYEYGNNGIAVGNHYVRMVQPLSRDLDEISKQLFALRTDGGEEYCGAVIQRALTDLQWDKDPRTYKALFVAGNEPFTQGPVSADSICRVALGKQVIVNTIHCGTREEGIRGRWHDGAAMGGGEFMIIDQDKVVTHIRAPQDARIEELGKGLNETYIPYGDRAMEGVGKQMAADECASANAGVGSSVQRAISKASANYCNDSWDLVDAVRHNQVDWSQLPAASLPGEMRGLSQQEIKAHVEKEAARRVRIQNEILELQKQRDAFVRAERAKLANDAGKTLDQVLVDTARSQAAKFGYRFGK